MSKLEDLGGKKNHIVLKIDDCTRYLDENDRRALIHILDQIQKGRVEDGRSNDNSYIVVNTDESYTPDIIDILKRNDNWG